MSPWETVFTLFGSSTIASAATIFVKAWSDGRATNSAEKMKRGESDAAVRTAEINNQPGLASILLMRIEKLETDLSELAREARTRENRMERESLRMFAHINEMHADYRQALAYLDRAESNILPFRPDWQRHALPAHQSIPSFADPKETPPKAAAGP